jgi:hypothetical protein
MKSNILNLLACILLPFAGSCGIGGCAEPAAAPRENDPTPKSVAAIPAAIAAAHRANVKESSGIYHHECFTDADYALFRGNKTSERVAAECLGKPEVRQAITALRAMSTAEQQEVFELWRRPLRKTWAQLGRVSPEGQTSAGQRAEIDIADAIMNAVMKKREVAAGSSSR